MKGVKSLMRMNNQLYELLFPVLRLPIRERAVVTLTIYGKDNLLN